MLELNVPQQAFTLFYAINWGTAANSQPRWKAFAWGAIGEDQASRRRAWLSVFLLNILPLIYFVVVLRVLDCPPWRDLDQWSLLTASRIFVSVLPAFAPFGFYRVWIGVVEKWREHFYRPLPIIGDDGKTEEPLEIWQEIGLELKLKSDLNKKWAAGNSFWGVVYIALGPVFLLLAILCARQ